ncbi:transposase [Lewinella aquimaris]|uniref:Transposase n=1 Tax=Neolewinella aquimaris TaxID=1835722 RepID=A0A840EHN0_9BACT|nr:IS630 family transposase [Neolewinella aquimaris]MBB4080406.1 transposase [Neolewinella aquimaris]
MELEVSQEQLLLLRQIQKRERFNRRRFVKATVLLMIHRGLSMEDIQLSLSLDDNTIRRYATGFKDRGLTAYFDDNYVPYCGKLITEQQEALLVDHLSDHLYLDVKPIIAYVKEQFGVTYTISGMRDLLHRLGFVYKHSKAVASKADEVAQVVFPTDTLPRLLREVASGAAEVYFSDGCHPTHNTKTGRGWIRKGQDFEVDCNSGRKRVNINAAVRASKPEPLVYDVAEAINAQSTLRLCRKLLAKHPGKTIYLICDNAGYNRCAWLQEWAASNRVEFVFLPAYSPNLNLGERWWKLLPKVVINSYYYEKHSKYREAVVGFLEQAKEY